MLNRSTSTSFLDREIWSERGVTDPNNRLRATVWAATLCSFAMIASQIAGKAVRDAMFLSTFGIEALPRIVILSSAVSLLVVLLAGRILRRNGSNVVVPATFATSAVVLLLLATTQVTFPRIVAVALYLHIAVFGAILVSWFWLLLNERLDVRTARKQIARVAAGGTLGGLVGGLLAERVGAVFSAGAMLPILAGLHAVCAYLATRIVTQQARVSQTTVGGSATKLGVEAVSDSPSKSASESATKSAANLSTELVPESDRGSEDQASTFGFRILSRSEYLRDLAYLVFWGTLAASLLDFAFKMHATQQYLDSRSLLRFFAGFYTITSLLTFVLQSFFVSRFLKSPRDLSRNVSFLPLGVVLGGLVSLIFPGVIVLAFARGLESLLRNSFFRSSYEVLFNPVSAAEKRATKTMIDVGCERLGDFVGGLLIQVTLLVVSVSTGVPLLLTLTILIAAALAWRVKRLHGGYVESLEGAIRKQVPVAANEKVREQMTQTLFLSDHGGLQGQQSMALDATGLWRPEDLAFLEKGEKEEAPSVPEEGDSVQTRIADLTSKHVERVNRALAHPEPLTPEMIPLAVSLLAWDPAYQGASQSLQVVVQDHFERLIETMIDPTTDFAIRRRLPFVLARGTSPRIVKGLLQALRDQRFEVRYRAAVALNRIHRRVPDLVINRDIVLEVIFSESKVGRRMWDKRRLLDRSEDTEETPFYRDVLRRRSNRSIDHVFHLLALTFPRQPLRVAYDGLHTTNRALRATALEYLESILPDAIRQSLLPLLGGTKAPQQVVKSEGELLDSLLLSHASIVLELNKLKPAVEDSEPDGMQPEGEGPEHP